MAAMRNIRNLLFGLFALPFFLSLFAAEEELPPDPLRDRALAGEVAAQLQLANEFFFGWNRLLVPPGGGAGQSGGNL